MVYYLSVDGILTSHYRGSDFTTEYGNIAELRSIVSRNFNLMALSATVTPSNRYFIMQSLCMDEDNTFVLARVPNKLNIRYGVQVKPSEMELMTFPIVSCVKHFGSTSPKTIIFYRTYKDFTEVASCLVYQLHESSVFFSSLYCNSDGSKTPVCEMYSASTGEAAKDNILLSFTDPDGAVRIVITTIAFGMGLDAPNVSNIIHWGSSESTEAYTYSGNRKSWKKWDVSINHALLQQRHCKKQ